MKRFMPHLIIILFSIVAGYFIWNAFYVYKQPLYPLNWDKAQWISTKKSPVGLFRKELFIPNKVTNAWIQISAPDVYDLHINGQPIITNTFYSSNVSGIHDLSDYLHIGKNVIAISVRRISFPGQSKVVVKGAYTDATGNEITFISDRTWKVYNHEDKRGDILWHSPLFDASSWPSPIEKGSPDIKDTYPVAFPPQAIALEPFGSWIRHPMPLSKQANFIKEFNLIEKPDEAWIRIISDVEYDLIVNDINIGNSSSDTTLDIFNIDFLLKKGINKIELALKNPFHRSCAIYLDGIFKGEKYNLPIVTDTSWKAYDLDSNQQVMQPLVIGNYSSYQYKIRSKRLRDLDPPFNYKINNLLNLLYVNIYMIFFSYLLIYLPYIIFARFIKFSSSDYCLVASYTFILPIVLLVFLLILEFDIRIYIRDIFTSYFVYGMFLFVFLSQIVLLHEFKNQDNKVLNNNILILSKYNYLITFIAICFIILCGCYFRLNNLGYISLNGDEIGTLRFGQTILEKGYPFINIGGINKPTTTYELLSYPVALSFLLFGISDISTRLPSAVFGIANIIIIFLIGKKLINTRTGLLAALIYCFMPLEINLAQNARYMVAEQFYAMLCCYFFWIAIKDHEINKKAVYLSSIFFVLSYLTWEGSGYLLVALFVATLIQKGRNFNWMKNWHLWIASVCAVAIVLLQIANRTYWSVPFMILGAGLSESTFKLMFLTQVYNPWFYVKNFLLTQTHIFLTFLVVIGSPYIIRKKELKFLFIILCSVIFLFSNTFSLYAIRYIYFIQPFLIILACAILFKILDIISALINDLKISFLTYQRVLLLIFLPIILFTTTNDFILKLYRLSANPKPTSQEVEGFIFEERRYIYPVDFRDANTYVKENLEQGDIVVSVYTHPTLYYSGKLNYFQETIIDTQIIYLDDNSWPRLVNKTVDVPTITSISAFKNLLAKHQRIWFVAHSYGLFNYLNNKEFIFYFKENFKPVYETYNARVYLWENGKKI